MAPPTNQELNEKREKNCVAVTVERKYYKVGNTWIKRSLRPSEWQKQNGFMHVPLFNTERILNEGECLEFLAKHTDIPLPRLIACFEDDGAAYLITEYVDGVGMNKLDADGQAAVAAELQRHMQTLKGLTSDTWGGPSGVVLPPHRIIGKLNGRPLRMLPCEKSDLVFCHNDLSMDNVIVDEKTFKIKAIIDWEYAGFFSPEFERPFYQRAGPSIALRDELDDTGALMDIISKQSEYTHRSMRTLIK
ncbi:hypothetical protein Forpi1262_v014343 [Fusarium oxysporum f. sp. raphani]|uniref:Aminoglycoside phosphotransferase domain-containing protein n=1 Tax=Fusarium oxysporum f. sp. raphani TaxID=96318 RepID=A0A8J5PEK3_FUSOX|nr:hypothetical protein Forpi1262_v014343 [Fusarium oxysporum f. sp. raphani]